MFLRKLNNESGSALLVTLTLLGLLFLLGTLAINNSVTETDLSFNKVHSDNAYYIAQAGARKAFAEVRDDPTWRAGYSDVSFDGGSFTVSLADSTTNAALADTILVVGRGTVDGASRTVELTLLAGEFNPFTHAMFGKSLVDIRNSFATDSYNSDSGSYAATRSTDDGDVGSNGNIIVKNGAFVGGDIATSLPGGTDIHPGATVTGSVTDAAPEVDLPDVPQDQFDAAEASSMAPAGLSGSFSYDAGSAALESTGNVELSDGVYYFSSIILKNSASLTIAPGANVTIYVTGDIEMKNSSEMNAGGDSGDLVIYSQGDLVLKNSGDIAAVFYNPNGTADLRNSGDFYGSVIGDRIICHNSANFHYDRNLGNVSLDDVGDLKVVAFREL